MTIDSAVTLPALTGSATAATGAFASSVQALPAIVGEGAASGPTFLPAIVGGGSALTGALGRSTQSLPALIGTATADAGTIGSSVQTLPAIVGNGGGASSSIATLPALTGEGSALVGGLASSTATLPALTGEASASTPLVASSIVELPLPLAEGHAITGAIGSSSATLAALLVASSGYTGQIGSSTLSLPVITGAGTAHEATVGTSIVTLPAIIGTATASTARGATYAGYAWQTERRALTTYSNVPLNGLAAFNGVYLAAGPGGLFVLEGDDDDGALIQAAARLALTDFGDPHLKRVDKLYLAYRSTGELTLNVTVDRHTDYVYTVPMAHHDTLTAGRVPLGRGMRGAWWQLELANRDGADFTIERLDLDVQPLSRKVG